MHQSHQLLPVHDLNRCVNGIVENFHDWFDPIQTSKQWQIPQQRLHCALRCVVHPIYWKKKKKNKKSILKSVKKCRFKGFETGNLWYKIPFNDSNLKIDARWTVQRNKTTKTFSWTHQSWKMLLWNFTWNERMRHTMTTTICWSLKSFVNLSFDWIYERKRMYTTRNHCFGFFSSSLCWMKPL